MKYLKDITYLRSLGYIIEVLDASLGGIFPVTAISLINPKNSTLFVSFGSHPILEVALERTMTELMQGRELDNLDNFETPSFDMELVGDYFNIEAHFIDSNGKLGFQFLSSKESFKYTPWEFNEVGSKKEYEYLINILNKQEKQLYIREYNYLGFYSCQIIVPNFSEVYPIEDMIYNNKNSGKLIRDMILNFEVYDFDEVLNNIEDLDNSLNIQLYIGVIFEENFTMGEFKAQILILLNEYEQALEILEYSQNSFNQILAELIKMKLAKLKFQNYEDALYNIYGKDKITKAQNILKHKELLINRKLHSDYYKMLEMFDKLEVLKKSYYK